MKKVLLLSGTALSLTLFSFLQIADNDPKQTNVVGYNIQDATRLSALDIKKLSSESRIVAGAGVFKTSKIFKTKIASNQVEESIVVSEQKDCPCPPEPSKPAPTQLSSTQEVIAKYDS